MAALPPLMASAFQERCVILFIHIEWPCLTVLTERRSHWKLAHERLPEKYKGHLDITPTIGPNYVLRAVEDRKRESEKNQWIIKTGSKQTLKLRDVFNKIAKWVEKFIEVGDIAVQYDPLHAALPWAALRFILKVSQISDYDRTLLILLRCPLTT